MFKSFSATANYIFLTVTATVRKYETTLKQRWAIVDLCVSIDQDNNQFGEKEMNNITCITYT